MMKNVVLGYPEPERSAMNLKLEKPMTSKGWHNANLPEPPFLGL
jgi:hypothetical protein